MAKFPQAIWDPIIQWPTGPMIDKINLKVVWHMTQGSSYPRSTYVAGGGVPHFTILTTGVIYQHYSSTDYSRALLNLPGGVTTNHDGAIQVEVVGFAGTPITVAQASAVRALSRWLGNQGVPGRWMNGAPTKRKHDRHGQVKLSNVAWDNGSGHCGHSDVPENNHWDPAMTLRFRRAVEAPWQTKRIRARIQRLRARIKALRERLP